MLNFGFKFHTKFLFFLFKLFRLTEKLRNITRIMKKAVPANAKITKDAKEIMQYCVSEFIFFVTSE